MQNFEKLLKDIKACRHCETHLPHGANPVMQASSSSKLVIIGQAPGIRVHESGIPWNDPSGERLREWLNMDKDSFYDTSKVAIVPMGFCYPGTGKSGDLPPRPECAPLWMNKVLSGIKGKPITLLIGQYAQKYFLKERRKKTLTETVQNWREYLPEYLVLPHPSPRNNIWLKKNPWFERDLVPELQKISSQI